MTIQMLITAPPGETYSLRIPSGSASVAASMRDGTMDGSEATCVGAFDETYDPLLASCT
ncbi:MAG: hypothetical protein HRT86_11260 [Ilumatobacteraceae bacterium]|nr:hypothetical protein [Ilumatobacteraceae bacterium]